MGRGVWPAGLQARLKTLLYSSEGPRSCGVLRGAGSPRKSLLGWSGGPGRYRWTERRVSRAEGCGASSSAPDGRVGSALTLMVGGRGGLWGGRRQGHLVRRGAGRQVPCGSVRAGVSVELAFGVGLLEAPGECVQLGDEGAAL